MTDAEIRMTNDQARKKYGRLFDDVAAVLFRHDPIGINFSTNADEYTPEARTILPRLVSCQSEADALRVVLEEFHRWFGEDIHEEKVDYKSIAADVWNLWSQRAKTG
jgi:hypothetical protein